MTSTDEISGALIEWSPRLTEVLTTLSYLGSTPSLRWLTTSKSSRDLELLAKEYGQKMASEIWRRVLKDNVEIPTAGLLIVLEHMRQNPSAMNQELKLLNFSFSKTLANLSFRVAGSLYEDAKSNFAQHEIDVAVSRFLAALSEFRFSIESGLLSDKTRKIATGKYATAVAMIGRWVTVTPETLVRALNYSKESMALGNQQPETLTYRLELLVLYFDQTGNELFLQEALNLISDNKSMARGSELVEAEARYRIAMAAPAVSAARPRQLALAKECLALSRPKIRGSVEEARCRILASMLSESERGKLITSARLTAIPKGILAQMATGPSRELWKSIRRIIKDLQPLRKAGSVPAAVLSARFLRQIVDGPNALLQQQDLTQYVDITKGLYETASYNRHLRYEAGAAALSAAKRSPKKDLARKAEEIFSLLSVLDPKWPLPRIGIARVRDYLTEVSGGKSNNSSGSWREAATLALNAPNYARSNLGGRNQVFAVTDARGLLSEAFVFKRTTKAKAEHEALMLNALRLEILHQGRDNIFEVPRSLAIVEIPSSDDRKWVHVTQRSAGRLVSEMSVEDVSALIEPIVELLAIFHRVAGQPPEGKSAWRPLKDYLKMWSKALFDPDQADAFVDLLRKHFPSNLPLVRKRDGHASNWLIDPAGRVVAIDFESVEFIPSGYDVAQLIEDNALVPPTAQGWQKRLNVLKLYLNNVGHSVDDETLTAAYGWFAITRALRLGTERQAGKSLRRHAREACVMLAKFGDPATQKMAQDLMQALSRVDRADAMDFKPSHDHRRLSKAMAYQLRHHGPNNNIPVDAKGFASMEDLAACLKVDTSNLLAVAEHPGEPRFEVRDGLIRALYGHSLQVNIDVGIKVGTPTFLFHGSSWTAIDSIVSNGLKPVSRQMVHLTNNANEAMAVGERKGAGVLLSIKISNDEEPVAEGIWVAQLIDPARLSIINPFNEESGVSE